MNVVHLKRLIFGLTLLFMPTPRAWGEVGIEHDPCRVLIVTGEDHHHDWRSTTPVLYRLLHQDPRLRVDVLSDLTQLESTSLDSYQTVILHFRNAEPEIPGRKAFDNLRHYVHGGGGLVLVHFACGAFQEFKPEYEEMVGQIWFGLAHPSGRKQHDTRGPFTVEITSLQHPITTGMTNIDTDDELYTCLEGKGEVKVLAVARSKRDDQLYPMVLLHKYGEGRVFNCTLGHDTRALKTELVGELYRRGCAWSAGLPPVSITNSAD